MDELALDELRAYFSLPAGPTKDPEVKREKSKQYVDGLLEHGGPSTDVFKEALGEEKTGKLFREVLFKV